MELEQHQRGDKTRSVSEVYTEGTAVGAQAGYVASDDLRARQCPFGVPGAEGALPGKRYRSLFSSLLSHRELARTCSRDTGGRGAPSPGQRARPTVSSALQSFRAINLQLCGRCSCRLDLILVVPFVDERGRNGRG